MIKFTAGKEYSTRSICDAECIFKFTVISRTEKTVTIQERGEKTKRCKIHYFNNTESIFPLGQYSMAPILRAEA